MNILLEIHNSFWICAEVGTIVSGHKRKLFNPWKVEKIWLHVTSFDDITKTFFHWKIPKIHTFLDSTGNQLSKVIISKFGIEMPDTCDHITERFNIFNDYLAQKENLYVEFLEHETCSDHFSSIYCNSFPLYSIRILFSLVISQ